MTPETIKAFQESTVGGEVVSFLKEQVTMVRTKRIPDELDNDTYAREARARELAAEALENILNPLTESYEKGLDPETMTEEERLYYGIDNRTTEEEPSGD